MGLKWSEDSQRWSEMKRRYSTQNRKRERKEKLKSQVSNEFNSPNPNPKSGYHVELELGQGFEWNVNDGVEGNRFYEPI